MLTSDRLLPTSTTTTTYSHTHTQPPPPLTLRVRLCNTWGCRILRLQVASLSVVMGHIRVPLKRSLGDGLAGRVIGRASTCGFVGCVDIQPNIPLECA